MAELFHHALDQLFGVGEILHDELDVHDGLAGPALALAINAVLADESHGVGKKIHGDSEPAARNAHAGFEVFELFLLFVEDSHGEIVMAWDVGMLFHFIHHGGTEALREPQSIEKRLLIDCRDYGQFGKMRTTKGRRSTKEMLLALDAYNS